MLSHSLVQSAIHYERGPLERRPYERATGFPAHQAVRQSLGCSRPVQGRTQGDEPSSEGGALSAPPAFLGGRQVLPRLPLEGAVGVVVPFVVVCRGSWGEGATRGA